MQHGESPVSLCVLVGPSVCLKMKTIKIKKQPDEGWQEGSPGKGACCQT